MAQSIFHAKVIQGYRNKRKVYNWLKGHTGVDLDFFNEDLESPITGVVRQVTLQKEMGKCIYIIDALGNCHVFAHMLRVDVANGQHVMRGQKIGITGNSGTVTTGPHLHFEIICPKAYRTQDLIMGRSIYGVKGYNTSPIDYLKDLYKKYNIQIP